MMELRGDIPGLLRRSTPVVDRRRLPGDGEHAWQDKPPRGIWSPQGPKADEGLVLWDRSAGQRQRVEERVYAGNLLLDTEDATGRFHARLWLLERGHDVGSEDRAEVLAWSVLSVWRGGGPIRLVMGHWWQQGLTWRRDGWRGMDKVTAAVGPTNCSGIEWEILTWFPNSTSRDAGHYGRGFESIEAAKAACDAAAIASRWALTNPDGSLTLPPLPGAS